MTSSAEWSLRALARARAAASPSILTFELAEAEMPLELLEALFRDVAGLYGAGQLLYPGASQLAGQVVLRKPVELCVPPEPSPRQTAVGCPCFR